MANRYSDWNTDISKEIVSSAKKRKLFFIAMREEYQDDLEALRASVKIIGLKEYSLLCEIPSSNIKKYLTPGRDLKLSTLSKLLEPFSVEDIRISYIGA
ncbi:MAG: hypothetical protein CL674_00895 [Bdellovibrionaceae bacterium]|nr:hypothetical protein [Pseudobdellovibrionaceae bacterium]|tara:strand:- start:446 stop:742 length:297 start_codon:yes stop_codon:yes gene_type:complete